MALKPFTAPDGRSPSTETLRGLSRPGYRTHACFAAYIALANATLARSPQSVIKCFPSRSFPSSASFS